MPRILISYGDDELGKKLVELNDRVENLQDALSTDVYDQLAEIHRKLDKIQKSISDLEVVPEDDIKEAEPDPSQR